MIQDHMLVEVELENWPDVQYWAKHWHGGCVDDLVNEALSNHSMQLQNIWFPEAVKS